MSEKKELYGIGVLL